MKRKGLKITGAIILLILVVYAFLPRYAQRALIYLTVDIDDYKIFNNREVVAADPEPWEKAPSYGEVKIPDNWVDSLAQYNTVAYAIIKDSMLFLDEYWMGYSDSSYSNSFSAGKTIVGFSILSAIDHGFIESLDQRVSDFVPEYDNPENKDLRIRDVMTMSSGLNWVESYGGLFNTTTESYYGSNLMSLITGLKVEEEPGKVFKYKSGNTQLLSLVLENATNMTMSDYVGKYFWTPMNAQYDALWSLDKKNGVEKAYCCFNSNAKDFARWGELMLSNGNWNGKQLVSKELMTEAMTPATYLVGEDGDPVDYYGYQLWILNYKGMHIPYMRGILGQYVFAIPEKNMVVVRLGDKRSRTYINHHPKDVYTYIDLALELTK
ncbi:serine hydrolase domain-containing protein [Saccharicrinis sp. FJH54]|uniref:serine hydrolase domain-containing protein n=1 Tax=Saccharicrinis sp. FJH54 TaxID=3344665 RepID=UPI0035D4392C